MWKRGSVKGVLFAGKRLRSVSTSPRKCAGGSRRHDNDEKVDFKGL